MQERLDDVFGQWIDLARPVNFALENLLVDPVRGLIEERWIAYDHLVAENTARPPVRCLSVAVRLDDFWRKVLGRPAQRPRTVVDNFGETEIRETDVAAGIQEQVLGLQVTIDDVEGVEVLERENDSSEVETSNVRGEAFGPTEVCEKLSPGNIRHQHVDVEAISEGRVEVDDERMAYA